MLIRSLLLLTIRKEAGLRLNRSRFGGLKYLKLTGKRAKALVGVAAVVPALAISGLRVGEHGVLIGSGSSAAQPYMLRAVHRVPQAP